MPALMKFLHIAAAIVWLGGISFMLFALRPAAAAQLAPPQRLPGRGDHDGLHPRPGGPRATMNTRKKSTPPPPSWTDRFTKGVSRETLAAHPWLKPVAHHLREPGLWHVQHEAVARGVAIGVFWAFALPVAQILVACVHCIWWRGNIPVAAGVTLITNPFTIGFWLWLAYKLGSLILGISPHEVEAGSAALQAASASAGFDVMGWLQRFGWPAVLGMAIFSVAGSAGGYVLVKLIWRFRVWFKRRVQRHGR